MNWVDYVEQALTNLGGMATLSEIYAEVERIRSEPFAETWQATIRRTLQNHSSDAQAFLGNEDLFYSVKGLRSGVWGLRKQEIITPNAVDKEDAETVRVKQTTYRILRDTNLARRIKQLYDSTCQMCDFTIQLPNGQRYSEAHHIKPLGLPHSGPDIANNILCTCPNHHAMLDYGAIRLNKTDLKIHSLHRISDEFIAYHNEIIFNKA